MFIVIGHLKALGASAYLKHEDKDNNNTQLQNFTHASYSLGHKEHPYRKGSTEICNKHALWVQVLHLNAYWRLVALRAEACEEATLRLLRRSVNPVVLGHVLRKSPGMLRGERCTL